MFILNRGVVMSVYTIGEYKVVTISPKTIEEDWMARLEEGGNSEGYGMTEMHAIEDLLVGLRKGDMDA